MRKILFILFFAIFVAMISITIVGVLHENLFTAGAQLWPDPWFRATLFDAYFAFITFIAWVVYKEKTIFMKIIWTLLILSLGSIAMSFYVLMQLFRMGENATWADLLLKK
jgi:hypothetical protein